MLTKNYQKLRLRCLTFAIILTLPLSAMCTPVPDECVRGEPIPVFNAGRPGIRAHNFVSVSSHEANEFVTLSSGEAVEIHHGGCEYFVTTFRFHSKRILKDGKSPRDAYKTAAALLRRIGQLKEESGFDLIRAAGTLEAAVRRNPGVNFEEPFAVEGDGIDFLQAQVQVDALSRKGGIGFLQVSLFRGPL
jgi:hypothetical protein